jgi:hypothetical protein
MTSHIAEPEPSPSPPCPPSAEPCSDQPAGGGFSCLDIPELKRLQYFFGQVLGPQDFRDEQTYFREKLKLHNRCLHGYGVVCGLEVLPVPPADPCDPEPKPRTLVRIRRGLAYDCAGNELVVRRDLIVDLLAHLPPRPAQGATDDVAFPVWLSLCFCEQPVDPARPVLPDACDASPDCVYGKLRDAVRVRVSLEPPREDERCDSCCSACTDPCVLLARIDDVLPGWPIRAEQIHNEARRPITPYLATRVAAVSWSHGAVYTVAEASELLSDLKVRFTHKILSSTLRPGVVDVWVVEGGGGRHADIYNRDVQLEVPGENKTDTLIFHADTGETLQDGDRVLITIRTSFLLDGCCRPVDGENVGGRVPVLADSPFPPREPVGGPLPDCLRSPGSFGPWTSGNGTPAGTFESWFFVKDSARAQKQRGGTPK